METDDDGADCQLQIEAMDTQEAVPLLTVDESTAMNLTSEISPSAQRTIRPIASNTEFVTTPITATTIADSTITEDEEMCSEATFRFLVENFSVLNDTVLSPPCYVRNIPWKIMVKPMSNDPITPENSSFGFFLQCNGENESSSWSCYATAELRIISLNPDKEPFSKKILHNFFGEKNDWGFKQFIPWAELLNPDNEFIQNDAIELEVQLRAEIPHGVFWDSKKHTGFVGLKNQGATCYMNSLLQTLFFTNHLRKAIYKMPTEADDSRTSVALSLQRVFHELQFSDTAVETKKLTQSFGWEALDSSMQHDVQEFLRVLLDTLESKMEGTCVEGTIPHLFEGNMSSYIKCKNVDYGSTRLETFYDIQLNIKGKKNITESFRDYIGAETLDGDNKYEAGENGLQEAEKGVIFVSFPPILHLHLMRFEYDPITENSVKFNDRFEFYEHIQLDEYLEKRDETDPADYTLHAVLVHSGITSLGHYVAYINPLGDGRWCKFDDAVVSRCPKSEAIERNYGCVDDEFSLNASSSAYMLVYIRDSAMSTVLQEIHEYEIPTELTERLLEERRIEEVVRLETNEAKTYMAVYILLEDYFEGHQSTDLFDKVQYRVFKMKKQQTILELIEVLQKAFRTPAERMRLWPLSQLHKQVTRPLLDDKDEMEKTLFYCSEFESPWIIFLEILPPDSMLTQMPPFEKDLDIILFFKHYDPASKRLDYCGLGYYSLTRKLSELVADMNQRLGFCADTELTVYEEQCANIVLRINDHNETLEKAIKVQNFNAAVLIFENKICGYDNLELPTCEDYFRDLRYRVDVTFIDKANMSEPGFSLELSLRLTYDQMASAVGKKINHDPNKIQFFKRNPYKDAPGQPLLCSSDDTLMEWLVCNRSNGSKKIFYQQLSMNITILESKKQFKCTWISINMKEEKALILYPNKDGTVKTLLEEAAKQIELNCEDGSGHLRIVKISNFKVLPGPREEEFLKYLQNDGEISSSIPKYQYRIEEIPKDEANLAEDEMLIPVSHFYKTGYDLFGIPFYVKIKQGEPLGALKERIQKKCGVSDKEWEKYKIAFISGTRLEYLTDDDMPINLYDFRPAYSYPYQTSTTRYLGLEHMNRSSYKNLEKAIKIYN